MCVCVSASLRSVAARRHNPKLTLALVLKRVRNAGEYLIFRRGFVFFLRGGRETMWARAAAFFCARPAAVLMMRARRRPVAPNSHVRAHANPHTPHTRDTALQNKKPT